MAGRSLAPQLSDVTVPPHMPPLEEWQLNLMDRVTQLYEQAFQDRRLLTPMVMSLPNPSREQVVPMLASLAKRCCCLTPPEAENLALASVQCPAVGEAADGIICVSPFAWSYIKGVLMAWPN